MRLEHLNKSFCVPVVEMPKLIVVEDYVTLFVGMELEGTRFV